MVPFLGVEFGLKGEAIIPFDKARIHPLGFESLLSNSGSILELICFSRPYIQEFSFTRVFCKFDLFLNLFLFNCKLHSASLLRFGRNKKLLRKWKWIESSSSKSKQSKRFFKNSFTNFLQKWIQFWIVNFIKIMILYMFLKFEISIRQYIVIFVCLFA